MGRSRGSCLATGATACARLSVVPLSGLWRCSFGWLVLQIGLMAPLSGLLVLLVIGIACGSGEDNAFV